MLYRSSSLLTSLFLIATFTYTPAQADMAEFAVQIKNHQFEPATLEVPAGAKFRLKVSNLDSTPEEFESHALNREKMIPGQSRATLYIGPLDAGEYDYLGEFNPDTAIGKIIAK